MNIRKLLAIALTVSTLALAGCATTPVSKRAVVIMSGGGAVSPYTTPTQACATGLAAGNTDTALREYLLAQGKEVYTAPAMSTWGKVVEPEADSFGAFGDCPEALPESLTVMSGGDITASGESLTRFVMYLHDTFGITDVDFVGHSNGGLYSRTAIRLIKQLELPIKVQSLTMLGTPNEGAFPTAYTAGELSLDECAGDAFCIDYLTFWKKWASTADRGLNGEDTARYLDELGWNDAQQGYLDDVPVFMIGGSYWENPAGNPVLWPYDGTTPVYSALAQGVSDSVIPHRACWVAPLTHSIFTSDYAGLDWQTAMTWNTDSLKQVNDAIDNAEKTLTQPTGKGC